MEKKDNMPLWVFFGISSINTRKGGMMLVWSCVVCGILFLPWTTWVPSMNFIPKDYRIDDLSWAAPTFLIAGWYWMCVRWVDKHSNWS